MAGTEDPSTSIVDTTSLAATAEPPCPLLDKLPPELRNEIYALAFADDTCAGVAINLLKANPPSNAKALIQTCRQINSEAGPLYKKAYQAYWTSNSFQIRRLTDDSFEKTMAAVERVSEEALCRITHLEVYHEYYFQSKPGLLSHSFRLVDARGAWLCPIGQDGSDALFIVVTSNRDAVLLRSREELAHYFDEDEERPSRRQQVERLLLRKRF